MNESMTQLGYSSCFKAANELIGQSTTSNFR